MNKLLFSIIGLAISVLSQAQSPTPTSKDCDSIKVTSLEYPLSGKEIESFGSGDTKEFIKINLEYLSISTDSRYISYPVWSVLNENGDTLGANFGYTYTFGFNSTVNLAPRSKLVADSQEIASSLKLYIHLYDNFDNENSNFSCVLPFFQIPLGVGNSANELGNKIAFYPNPSSNMILFHETQKMVRLFDAKGKEVYSKENVNQIDVSQFLPGMYSIMLTSQNGNPRSDKLVID